MKIDLGLVFCVLFPGTHREEDLQTCFLQLKSSLTVKLHWTSSSLDSELSSRPPDSGNLIYRWNATCTFYWEEDFGPLSNGPDLCLLSSGETLLTSLAQERLDTKGASQASCSFYPCFLHLLPFLVSSSRKRVLRDMRRCLPWNVMWSDICFFIVFF